MKITLTKEEILEAKARWAKIAMTKIIDLSDDEVEKIVNDGEMCVEIEVDIKWE